jgi:hypothetical protein
MTGMGPHCQFSSTYRNARNLNIHENVKITHNGQIHHFKHMDADIATIIISRPNNPESGEVGV